MPKAEPIVAERQAQLEAILRNAVDAIITIDEQGRVESANPATETMFGYSAKKLIGRKVTLLMPAPYRDEHDEYLARYLRTGETKVIGGGREVVGRRKNGETFPIHLAVSEVKVGPRRLFTGIARDISELKAAEQRLANMNEELEERVRQRTADLHAAQAELVKQEKLATLGQVAGGIAHEIRNPLNTIKTSAYYLLHARNASLEKQAEHLHRIDRQVTMIDNVIAALSDVARLPDATLRPMSLESCLRDVVRELALSKEVRVVWEILEPLPPVLADDNQIPIVIRNLLCNRRDAMPGGGTLTISASSSDDLVQVAFRDTGGGIGAEVMNRIMEPLYSTKARGMGLGLVISRTILDKNRGSLHVTSQLGSGSTFTMALPVATD